MIVGVCPGEKVEAGDPGLIEAGDVGRLIGVRLDLQVEACGDIGLLEKPRPSGTGSRGLDGELVVLHAADHVEVQVRREILQRHWRVVHVRGRSQQSQFLARPELEQQMPRPRLVRQQLADGQHRSASRGVVVGAEVHLTEIRLFRERIPVSAPAQVIVVRA